MCGFLGWQRAESAPWSEAQIAVQARALRALVHRGPDDGSEARGAGWWMGFRRLAILDLSDHGRQPMTFAGGLQTLTFNGEIYNFRELRAAISPATLASSGDTAVLGTLLTESGVQPILPKLRGMFAFAWRDADTHTVTLARDAFGIKPLYYALTDEGDLIYGSELRAVRMLGAGGALCKNALADYLRWGAVQAPETMFDGVRCLPPGHLLVWRAGRIEIKCWHLPAWPGREAWVHDVAEQRDLVRTGVLASVKAHLVSDVPVGVFLSGGLDSSLLTACMREAGPATIRAFSIGYEERSGVPDESAAAQKTAEFYGCDFVRERLTADAVESKLDSYFDHMDQPTGDALNTWLVSQVAAREVKVALSGLGADEWWAGYNHHRLASIAARSPLLGAGALMRVLASMLPHTVRGNRLWKAAFHALGGAGSHAEEWQAFARTILPADEVAALLSQPSPASAGPNIDRTRASDSWLADLLLRETGTYLANTLLRDNDVTSMAHSLELRVPFVDVQVFDLAGRMPPEAKLNLRRGKQVLRDAFRDVLPPWINDDPGKKTFTLPLMKWMRLPKWRARIRDTLTSQRCRERGWMDARRVDAICARFFDSRDETKSAWHLSQPVWMLYVLEEWARRNLGAAT